MLMSWMLLFLLQFALVVQAKDEDCNDPLIVSSSKSNLTSSSSRPPEATFGPQHGKLYNAHAWCASVSAADQYLEIDLGLVMMIKSIAIQGNPSEDEFVKTFSLSYSVIENHWLTYEETMATTRVFKGSVNQELVAKSSLANITAARYVRFSPKTWFGHVCMRVELYGCEAGPFSSLGMTSGDIPNQAITASSVHTSLFPNNGRLLWTKLGIQQCWTAGRKNQKQWLQIDLSRMQFISGVATQGRHRSTQWVMSYWLSHSNDGGKWNYYQNQMTFTGNTDYERVVRRVISPVMWARYVRFMPLTWNNYISMRVEVYSFGRASPTDLGIDFTKKEIPDKQITASSYHTSSHRPEMARLNYPFNFLSWCPKDLYGNHWLQFDFGHAMLVTSIVTQGRGDADRRWLTEYKISYSLDNVAWTYYRKDVTSPVKVFKANNDVSEYVTRTFDGDVKARYVRIYAIKWYPSNKYLFMRASAIGRRKGPLGAPVLANQDSPSNIIAYQHDDVTLHCEAVGDWPMTFTWSFQGHVIESVNDSQLVLTNVTKTNEGFYACNATNSLGTNRKILHLEMKDSIGVCIRYKSFFGDIPLTSTSTTHLNDTISFNENDWYVFYGKRGYYRMPTKCVPQNYCSTEATGHMTGTLPTVNQGIVKRKVCFHSNGSCCHNNVDILVRNCNLFYVYKLKKLDTAWKAGYCVETYRNGNPGRMFSSSPTSLALNHHVIHRFFDITDGLDCMRCCTVDTACMTYNFSPNRATCELNNATADGEFASHLQKRPEFNYYREAGLIQSVGHDEL